MEQAEVMRRVRALANPDAVAGMARLGISPKNTLGISIPALRKLAKEIGTDHALAQKLWASGIHEARILASIVGDPKQVPAQQMEKWVKDFDSWDVCDQCCSNLFDKTPFAFHKAIEWSKREEEFVKRAGFALMASLAIHDKRAEDARFLKFLALIKSGAGDDRNFVKKAVNWALRQIGKRNRRLHRSAIKTAEEIQRMESNSARWVATDALRELQGPAVKKRLKG